MSDATEETPRDLRVGVIGVGAMGADHVERITRRIKGARVAVLNDYFADKAQELADSIPGAHTAASPQELIAADDVDAVLIASPAQFHEEQAITAIEAGKPVLCEKPLAMSPEAAHRVVAAEQASGRRYVTVGFMRRFDREYAELRTALDDGELGTPIIVNCKHRNAVVPDTFQDTMMVFDSAVHEVDAINFFLREPVTSVQVIKPTPSENAHEGVHDPMLIIFRTASGKVVTDELYVNTRAGYEVRTEIVGSKGIATIGLEIGRVTTMQPDGTWGGRLPADFRPRFRDAYDAEVQAWVDAVRDGSNVPERAAGAWDGYVTAAVCDAAARALETDGFVDVHLEDQP